MTVINPPPPTTLSDLAGMQWTATVNSIVLNPVMSLIFATGFIILDVPDPPPPLEIVGSGGVEVIDSDGAVLESSGFPTTVLIIEGSGGIIVGGAANEVLSADISGIYTLVRNKTNDTLYQRSGFSVFVGTEDVKIPNPFVVTAFIGG